MISTIFLALNTLLALFETTAGILKNDGWKTFSFLSGLKGLGGKLAFKCPTWGGHWTQTPIFGTCNDCLVPIWVVLFLAVVVVVVGLCVACCLRQLHLEVTIHLRSGDHRQGWAKHQGGAPRKPVVSVACHLRNLQCLKETAKKSWSFGF